MRAWLLLVLALSLLPSWAAADAPSASAARALTARVEALTRIESLDDAVKRPLAIAQRALADARAARGRGAQDAAAHDEALALAAVELAEARLRLLRERALLHAAEARHREALRMLSPDADVPATQPDVPR